MRIVGFEGVREEIIGHIRRKMLVPVIGSGFTRQCISKRGAVPSGQDYKEYMINEIQNALQLTEEEREELSHKSFSEVSEFYYSTDAIQPEKRREFIKNNFVDVRLEENKTAFLELPWPYIYTLNIDDGIESNSRYSHAILPNRSVEDKIFDEYCCVIKLHGDANDMITYKDSYTVLTQKQYINSLKKNSALLRKLEHDSIYENLLFVGCSLDDEMDLLAYSEQNGTTIGSSSKYYCTTKKPTGLTLQRLRQYGITCCIVFESYDSIYDLIASAGVEAEEIGVDELLFYKQAHVERVSDAFENNKPYFLFGKSLLTKENRALCLPYYFISREVTEHVISELRREPIQFIVGSGCSGKTYILSDIAYKVRDMDVYIFESKDRLTDLAFQALISKRNCLVLADSNSLSYSQIGILLDSVEDLRKNNCHVIIAANKRDGDLNSLIKLREQLGQFLRGSVPQHEINSRLTKREANQIIPLLTATDMGVYHDGKTLLDNIIDMGEKLKASNKYQAIRPRFGTIKEIAVLVALATEKKIYSQELIALDLLSEMESQVVAARPLIDFESTWMFEISKGDNSPIKYAVNAEYWLYRKLREYSKTQRNKNRIADAYKYIIKKQIENYGPPKLLYGDNRSAYRDYIKFDIINRVFVTESSYGRDGLALIRIIYESLNELLSMDPNYMHQRAKCYIKSARYEADEKKKLEYLDKAYRDTNVAEQVFTRRYEENLNEKLVISISHVTYTMALCLCHKCNVLNYQNAKLNEQAVELLYKALKSPYNSYDFAKTDSFNYQNVVRKLVSTLATDASLVSMDSHPLLEELFRIVSG